MKDTLTSIQSQNTHIIGVDTSVKDGAGGRVQLLLDHVVNLAVSKPGEYLHQRCLQREQVTLVALGPLNCWTAFGAAGTEAEPRQSSSSLLR